MAKVSSQPNHAGHLSGPIQAILLDIEGTTTPVDFVFSVLFPFAKDHVADFLADHGQEPDVQADVQLLKDEYERDRTQGHPVPDWSGTESMAAVPYILALIEADRKSTGLKSLQGKIWEVGYEKGVLRSRLFPDVKPAFDRWKQANIRLFIFSSGSVQAQQLLFRHTEAGDLTGYLSGYFDTRTGPKKEAESYRAIADAMECSPTQVLFISDVPAELKAAEAAGMQVLLSVRPGNHPTEPEGFPVIHSFDEIDFDESD